MENNNTFHYRYSAREQEEVKAIRNKYTAPKAPVDKLAELRRLDASVAQKATVISLIFGVIGTLVLGTGMSLAMTELGKSLGLSGWVAMLIGILIGIIGITLVSVAYPMYNILIKKERQRIAPEIIRLTDELMQ